MNKLKKFLIKFLGGVSLEDANRKIKEVEGFWQEIILSPGNSAYYRAMITKTREHQQELEKSFYSRLGEK